MVISEFIDNLPPRSSPSSAASASVTLGLGPPIPAGGDSSWRRARIRAISYSIREGTYETAERIEHTVARLMAILQ
jgi:hypothetical protein